MKLTRLLLALTTLAAAPAAVADTEIDACGAYIAEAGDYVLSRDIGPCAGEGIVIAASDVHLELAGHEIIGTFSQRRCAPEAGYGISVLPGTDNVRVSGGSVSGFGVGLGAFGSGGRFKALRLTNHCRDGAYVSGSGNQLSRSELRRNQNGIAVYGATAARITSNAVAANADGGILLGFSSTRSIVEANLVTDHDRAIQILDGFGNVLRENAHLDNAVGIALEGGTNTLVERNDVSGGQVGIATSAATSENSFLSNTARGNVRDALEASACSINIWSENDFGTTQGCIP